jgi:hypothetical protein
MKEWVKKPIWDIMNVQNELIKFSWSNGRKEVKIN